MTRDFYIDVKIIKYEHVHCAPLFRGEAYLVRITEGFSSQPTLLPTVGYFSSIKEIHKIIMGKKGTEIGLFNFIETLIHEKENNLMNKIINDKRIIFENKVYNITNIQNNNNIFSYKNKKYGIDHISWVENEEEN